MADARGIAPGRLEGTGHLLSALTEASVLAEAERAVLAQTMALLSSAAHGAAVEEGAGDWAMAIGPSILRTLDEKVAGAGSSS
ncbi:MAG: hypothetical protein RDU89_04830 [bacterium]|nr:hypothetical protein [bacterium]